MGILLDSLFIVFLLINVLKLGDILLRPYQQKWIQNKLETFVLKLDYLNVLDWFKRNLSSRFISLIGLFGFLLAFSFLHAFLIDFFYVAVHEDLILFLTTALLSLFGLNRLKEGKKESFNYLVGKDIEDNGDKYKISTFCYRAFEVTSRFLIIIIVLYLLYSTAIYFTYKYLLHEELSVLFFGLWFISPFMLDWLGFILTFVLMGVTSFVVFLLHFMIKIFGGICWRIVEYNKGAIAAISLIVTVILGIIEWYLKT